MGWEWQEQVPSGKFSEENNWMRSEVAGLQTHYHRKWYRLDATWEEKNVVSKSGRYICDIEGRNGPWLVGLKLVLAFPEH